MFTSRRSGAWGPLEYGHGMADVLIRTVDLAQASRQQGGSERLSAHLARPAGDGPWPGDVMVMEIFGVNDDMRAHAERMASWGYVVIVPDLYSDARAAVARGRLRRQPRRCRARLAAHPRLFRRASACSGSSVGACRQLTQRA
ncbi:hypothetical protein FA951_10130 [Dermacoccus nishinomiyaensis]|nr:hypothetical protein FA951_10130 [Dermacoccus nishinomiyaensis]